MTNVSRSFLIVALYLTTSVFVFSQSAPASVPPPAALYGESTVEWPSPAPDAAVLLTVAGPAGLYLRQGQAAGDWARFGLIDERGRARLDGVYKWELVVQAEWDAASPVHSGWFQLHGGRVVAEGAGPEQPVVVEENAPENSTYVDQEGRVGIGTSVPGARLHLKGTGPALGIGAFGFSDHPYQIAKSGDKSPHSKIQEPPHFHASPGAPEGTKTVPRGAEEVSYEFYRFHSRCLPVYEFGGPGLWAIGP